MIFFFFLKISATDTLLPTSISDCLAFDEYIQSKNGCFKVVMGTNGDLTLYRTSNYEVLWHSKTGGCTSKACMQPDGNFVTYCEDNTPTFNTVTYTNHNCRIVIQNDGNFVLYDPQNNALWNSNTITSC